MKKLTAILIFVVTLAASGQTAFIGGNVKSGLVGWWKMCGDTTAGGACSTSSSTTFADSSGYGQSGTFSTAPTWGSGKVGPNALSVTTSYSGTIASNTSTMPSSAMSVTAWVNQSTLGNFSNFASNNWLVSAGSWLIYANNAGQVIFGVTGPGASTQNNAATLGGSVLSPGVWAFVAGTYDGTTVRVYFNGVVSSNTATLSGQSLYQGSSVSISTTGYPFMINDVRFYNRALSATEIAQMYLAHN